MNSGDIVPDLLRGGIPLILELWCLVLSVRAWRKSGLNGKGDGI